MPRIFLILLCSTTFLFGQDLKKEDNIPLQADEFIGVDSFNNTFFIKDMALNKTGPLGSFVFQDFQLGPIKNVDIINPLNVVVFYEATNTVLFLDNRLNEIERINFATLPEFVNVSFATNAGNNRLWIFNLDSQQLELYNYRTRRKTVVSQPFNGTFVDQTSDFNYCFVSTSTAIYAFNVYGSILWKLPIAEVSNLCLKDDALIILQKEKLLYYNDKQKELIPLDIPEITIKDLWSTQEFLYIYDLKNIHKYTLTTPNKN